SVRADGDDRRPGEVARGDRCRARDALGPARHRQPDHDRHRDPRRGRGSGGGQPHGHRRQPDHLAHVPHRRGDGRRRRRPLRRAVRPDQPLLGLHPGAQGVHCRRARRHRQHSRRGARRGGEGARVTHAVLAVGLIGVSAWAVAVFPRSVLVFLLFQGSLLFAYVARILSWLRVTLLGLALLVLMPTIGFFNGYYLEVATQVGIFVALALGLNIVVGLAGLLDLGYVAFFAVGAYSWAIPGSPQANLIFGGNAFPL